MLCLIVDDNPNNRIVAEFICEDLEIETAEAESAKAALAYFDEGNIADVILLDWMMPDMDGVGFLREMKEKDIDVKVIMCTAKDSSAHKIQAMEAGADAYIQKPITVAVLENALQEIGLSSLA